MTWKFEHRYEDDEGLEELAKVLVDYFVHGSVERSKRRRELMQPEKV